MRILCLGSVNCWLITSSDTGHNQSPVPNINTAHFSWQRLNRSDAPTTLLNSITSHAEVRELFLVASEKMLFTPSKISSSVSSDCAAATNMRKIHFLSIHTQIYVFAASFLFAVLSCRYTDPLPTELTGSAERLIWERSTSECFLFLIESDTDKEFHFGANFFQYASLVLLPRKRSIYQIQAGLTSLPEFLLGGGSETSPLVFRPCTSERKPVVGYFFFFFF